MVQPHAVIPFIGQEVVSPCLLARQNLYSNEEHKSIINSNTNLTIVTSAAILVQLCNYQNSTLASAMRHAPRQLSVTSSLCCQTGK